MYRDALKGGPVLLSNSQAGPGRNFTPPRVHILVNPCRTIIHLSLPKLPSVKYSPTHVALISVLLYICPSFAFAFASATQNAIPLP